MSRLLPCLAFAAVLSACATVDHTSSAHQQLDKNLMPGPGDLLLRIDRERNLENAFGKADIFGRKTKEGFTELRFGGVESNGEIVLLRKDVQILTNETTMSRTPITTTTGRATTSVSGSASTIGNNTQIQGSGITNYSATTLSPASDFHVVVPADTVAVRIDSSEKRIFIAGYLVEIISSSRNVLEYQLTKAQ